MITAQEAEALAQHHMQEYVKACGCDTPQDVGNALMKLVSMCGLGMCATVGQAEAVSRLEGTALYVAKTQEGRNWQSERARIGAQRRNQGRQRLYRWRPTGLTGYAARNYGERNAAC